jgi:hypothetical protein
VSNGSSGLSAPRGRTNAARLRVVTYRLEVSGALQARLHLPTHTFALARTIHQDEVVTVARDMSGGLPSGLIRWQLAK